MDPGNWATDLAGGAQFGYALIWVLLMSNLMAILLQTLSARLGVVTGHDLAQACRAEYSPAVNAVLWVLAEVAIAATDLAEILGTIIALKLLFGLPLLWGCLVTAFDTFLLLYLQRWGMRQMEAVILALVATIGACFLIQIFMARPDWRGVVTGLRPSLPPGSLFVAIGILGATVMPHNLYLHSALVQTRRIGADRAEQGDGLPLLPDRFDDRAERGVLRQRGDPGPRARRCSTATASRSPASRRRTSCCPRSSAAAPILFGVALLCAGQSSTLTGTLAGQIVMEGYLHLRIAPWLRRLVTRLAGPGPGGRGDLDGGRAVDAAACSILSQVILSLQLSFAVIPLIHFTSNRRNMGEFATPLVGAGPGLDDRGDHRRAQRQAGRATRSASGCDGGGVGDVGRADPVDVAGGRGAVRRGRRRWRAPGLGDDQAAGGRSPAWRPQAQRAARLGRRRSGPARWDGSAWRWSTTRPTPRSSTVRWAWRRPRPAPASSSCSTWWTRR